MKRWVATGVMTLMVGGIAVLLGGATAFADSSAQPDSTTTSDNRDSSTSSTNPGASESTDASASIDGADDSDAPTGHTPDDEFSGDSDGELDDRDLGDADGNTNQESDGRTDEGDTETGETADMPAEVIPPASTPSRHSSSDMADLTSGPRAPNHEPLQGSPTAGVPETSPAETEPADLTLTAGTDDTTAAAESAHNTETVKGNLRADTTPTRHERVESPAQAAVSQNTVGISASIATTEVTPRAIKPTLLNYLGSIVLNVVMGLIHFIDGPPVLPANSTVTVRTSTLLMPVGNGRSVQAEWYFPEDYDESTRLVYFQHGIGASGPMYSYTLAKIAQDTQSIIVAPSLSSNFLDPSAVWTAGDPMIKAIADLFVGDRAALHASATAAAGQEITLPERFLLMGHSLGGYTTISSTRYLIDNGAIENLVGVVSLDGVDVNGTLPAALQQLTGENYRPIYHLSSEPYIWNLHGSLAHALEAVRPGQFNGVMLEGGRHIDALQGGNPLIQVAEYIFAGFSAPRNVEAVPPIAAGWVNDLFAGTHDGIYGAPGERIEIPTSRGTTAVVVLPLSPMAPVYGTAFDAISEFILRLIVRAAVYQPLDDTNPPPTGAADATTNARCVTFAGTLCISTAASGNTPAPAYQGVETTEAVTSEAA